MKGMLQSIIHSAKETYRLNALPYRPLRSKLKDARFDIVNMVMRYTICKNLEVRGDHDIPYDEPLILFPNHFSWKDPFFIHLAYGKNVPKEMKRYRFTEPIMRDDFFKNSAWNFNNFVKNYGTIQIDRDRMIPTAEDKENYGEVLGLNGTLQVFLKKSRSESGHILEENERYPPSTAVAIPRLIGIDKVRLLPTNYVEDPVHNRHIVSFGKPLLYEKPTDMKTRKAYFADLNDKVLQGILDLTPVTGAHIGSSYIKSLRDSTDGPLEVTVDDMKAFFINVIPKLKETGIPLGTDLDDNPFWLTVDYLSWLKKSGLGILHDRTFRLFEKKDDIDRIDFLNNQVSHVNGLASIVETEVVHNQRGLI